MRNQGKFFTFIGIMLILCAAGLTAYNIYEAYRAEKSSSVAVEQLKSELSVKQENASESESDEIQLPVYVLNPHMEMPVKEINGLDYIGILEIPALGLNLPVISELTDYSLKVSPCRYLGSAYTDDLIIAAHNYRSHFSNLKSLSQDDEIIFTDMDGNEFIYEVAFIETLQPTAIEEMESGEWDLTLFTCTIGGSYRVTVRCDRVY